MTDSKRRHYIENRDALIINDMSAFRRLQVISKKWLDCQSQNRVKMEMSFNDISRSYELYNEVMKKSVITLDDLKDKGQNLKQDLIKILDKGSQNRGKSLDLKIISAHKMQRSRYETCKRNLEKREKDDMQNAANKDKQESSDHDDGDDDDIHDDKQESSHQSSSDDDDDDDDDNHDDEDESSDQSSSDDDDDDDD